MEFGYLTLLNLVVPVYLVIVAGLLLRRAKLLTEEADQSLLRLTVNLLAPCLIVDSIVGNPALQSAGNIVLPPIVGFGTVVAGYALAWIAAPLFRIPSGKGRRTFSFTIGIFNYGFIPIPIVLGIFDRETLGVLFTFNLGVEIAFWTAGILILTGSSLRGGWKRALNAPVLAVVFAVSLNLLDATWLLPTVVHGAIHMIGLSAVPMSLILTGATLADWIFRIKPGSFGAVAVGAGVLRMALLPIAFLVLARYLPGSIDLKRVLVVQAAMPAAMIPVVISKHYGGDAPLALQVVLSTSILGLLTIPLWIRFGMHFVGI
jgi:hypothetical protein